MKPASRKLGPAAAALTAFTLSALLALVPLVTSAQTPDPSALLQRMAQVNSGLQSYTASVHAEIALHTFPFLSPALDGTFYFRAPDKDAIVFDTVPILAKQFQKVYPKFDPPSKWPSLYTISVMTEDANTTTLRLVPKKHGRVAHLDVRIDNVAATASSYTWTYEDGGDITFDVQYAHVEGNYLPKSQVGKVNLPSYKADVNSTFGNFKLNVPIADKVFET